MKSPPSISDDCDDIFGPPRTYPTGYCPPKNRPSMISAKYRQKEERRKVLKISLNKLKKIEDPEASLCRSVLINNTMKRLQKEARDEKVQKQQINYPKCFSDFVETDFDTKLAEEIVSVKSMEVQLSELVAENLDEVEALNSRKRPLDDEDCDVQDVLKQFYMPPTPRLLTSIDDDDDSDSGVEAPPPKRSKVLVVETPTKSDFNNTITNLCEKNGNYGVNHFINNNVQRYASQSETTDANSFSCGHASLFSELQSNVYHNLIASLET